MSSPSQPGRSALVAKLTRPVARPMAATYRWVDERMGISDLTHQLLYEATPRRGAWAYSLGSATLIIIVLQIVTGMFLLWTYVPSTTEAWESLNFIEHHDEFAAIVRGMHLWGAYVLLIIIGLHMIRTFVSGSYKKPRELNWIVGVLLFLMVLGLGITGAMLPWDQAAYWTAIVVTHVVDYIPLLGNWMQQILRGGPQMGPETLTRFFAIHIWLLPALLVPLIGLHLVLLRRHGEHGSWVNYEGVETEPEEVRKERMAKAEYPYPAIPSDPGYAVPVDLDDFFPSQVFKDAVVSFALVLIIFIMAVVVGAPLERAANPAALNYVPTPEWFFLPLDQLLVQFPQAWMIPVGVFVVPGIGTTLLILVPFLDRSPEREPWRRPEVMVPALFATLFLIFEALLAVNRLFNL
ncbi:MAG TPA: cytochrome b N-terminal domain-containing protein [Candidatus Micrarchaeaceae archaeon]|nr:cytochrome b N-terminal domain-containing protein [Candidatus Micrarchaeaceae archaeon]